MSRALTMLRYAMADLWADRVTTLMSVCLLSLIMIPPFLMYAAKYGLIGAWTDDIALDVANREVIVRGGKITRDFITAGEIAELRSWPETGFVVPEPAFSVRSHYWAKALVSKKIPPRSNLMDLGMRTTDRSDPVFAGLSIPMELDEVGLSQKGAISLKAGVGDDVLIMVTRETEQGQVQREFHTLRVMSVLDGADWPRATVFVSPGFSRAVRAYQYFEVEREAFPVTMDLSQATWASVRIYAKSIHDAPALQERLIQFGFDDTILHESQIARLLGVEKGISNGFALILILGIFGFITSLFFIEWLTAERKSSDMGLLFIIGFGFWDIALFRLYQTLLVVGSSAVLTIFVTFGTQGVFDSIGTASLGIDSVKPVPTQHLVLGSIVALLIGALGSIQATLRMSVTNLNAAVRED